MFRRLLQHFILIQYEMKKLDPLMWTSYEAICELGGPVGSSDEADDPNSIFGVEAPALSPRNMEVAGGQYNIPFKIGDKSKTNATDEASPAYQEDSFRLARFGTPSTPYSTFDKMTIGGNYTSNSQLFASAKGRASNIHNQMNRPATGSTVAPRSRASGDNGLPQTNLFNTPALAGHSIRSPVMETPAGPAPNSNIEHPSAIGYANKVLDQARRVVAGLYYEPSPEASIPRLGTPLSGLPPNRRNLADSHFNADVSAIPDTTAVGALSFSNVPSTPIDAPSPFHAGVSSVKGEKRALSPTVLESRKKLGQEKDKVNNPDDVEVVPGQPGHVEIDSETERQCVGKVLQLLCTFGAAYKYLCQVSCSWHKFVNTTMLY